MRRIIETLTVGPLECNCYIFGDGVKKVAAIIDPGADGPRIRRAMGRLGLKALYVINTHGHGDHIGADDAFGAPVYIHRADSSCLTDPARNLSATFGFGIRVRPPAGYLEDGQKIHVGDLVLEVIHTPGHSPGGVSLKGDGVIFTGDTLFKGGIGRTDLPGGSEGVILDSIFKKLSVLDDATIVYPGHGPSTTIGDEKRENPFLAKRPV